MKWLDALRATILDFENKPPEWGSVDCCQFASSYWGRVTGDYLAERLPYKSESEAMRIIAKHGGMSGMLVALLGEPNEAKAGSVVLCNIAEGDGEILAAGVHAGYCVFTVHPTEGLGRVPVHAILEGWQCQR